MEDAQRPERDRVAPRLPDAETGAPVPERGPVAGPDLGRPGVGAPVTGAADDLSGLSEREIEVLKLVATGATNQQVARALIISHNTVKVHLRNIFEKLGVQSRTEATLEAVRRGWVEVEGGAIAEREPAAGPASSSVVADSLAAEVGREASVEPVAAPVAPPAPRPRIARWQRLYLVAALILVVLVAWAPVGSQSSGAQQQNTPFSDVGRPQMAPAPREKVVRWTAKAAMPEARSRLAVAAVGGKLYAIGGETAAGATGAVAVYDPQSNGWLSRTSKPTPAANISATVTDNRIYVPGGTTQTGSVTNALEVYDPASDSWATRATLPVGVTAYGLTSQDGKIYLFGGWDGVRYRTESYVYDPAKDTWQAISPMPGPRAFVSAASLQNLIYVVGGRNQGGDLSDVLVYNPAAEGSPAGAWSQGAKLSEPRAGLGLLAMNGRLYAIGGGWDTSLEFNEQYDVRTGAWSRIESPVLGQWRNLGLVSSGDYIYAAGGWSGAYLTSLEQYRAVYGLFLPLGGNQSK